MFHVYYLKQKRFQLHLSRWSPFLLKMHLAHMSLLFLLSVCFIHGVCVWLGESFCVFCFCFIHLRVR